MQIKHKHDQLIVHVVVALLIVQRDTVEEEGKNYAESQESESCAYPRRVASDERDRDVEHRVLIGVCV